MKITLQRATDCIVNYLDGELVKISNPVKRYATMFSVGAMAANPSSFSDKVKLLGILDDQGMVDTDLVRAGFSMAFRSGQPVELLGLAFSQSDGEEILRRLEA